ncbi:alpha/beta hydrolase [Chryseobacterium gambrini]|uniref:Alpha/beta hydrolase n=2 Tax=Chryseobacterium TaxID=59732 RepID=A0AAJ1R6B4_9FLAO|nr:MULTISPECIES: alpha/beta hydrolase [Chryseobacterium]MDN4014302.1 alpha/beta hydrolase [Chryseobacterium gambrini]MDN4028247.1 alpha/beta hydrolase [Chryseobacterium gambrini]QWA39954.1 alpha/beta hydrolase [Chryseobacterium sp. ZHDP1]
MEGRIVNVNGKKLYTEYHNSFENKPTIVFLHDSLGCTQLWRDFPEKLALQTQCNVLVYDRLGYGKSFPMLTYERENNYMEQEADLLNDLLKELNINDIILFGHSDGGTIALIFAAKYPEKVIATLCEAGHIFVEDITVNGVKDAFEAYKTTNLPERLAKYHGDKVEMMVKAWTEIWLSDKFRSWNIEYLLKNITSPLLFIQGENDEYGTLDQVEKTISQVSGTSEKFIIPNIGHTPHKEIPDTVLQKSTEFISSIIKAEY